MYLLDTCNKKNLYLYQRDYENLFSMVCALSQWKENYVNLKVAIENFYILFYFFVKQTSFSLILESMYFYGKFIDFEEDNAGNCIMLGDILSFFGCFYVIFAGMWLL